VIATNTEYEPENLLKKYQKRGDSKNIIKEYKRDTGLRKFSSEGFTEEWNSVFVHGDSSKFNEIL
jgi:hypothetical protein